MTTTTITDPSSIERLGKLLAAMEAQSDWWEEKADVEYAWGHTQHSLDARRASDRALRVAMRTRRRLVDISALDQADSVAVLDALTPAPSTTPPGYVTVERTERYAIHVPKHRLRRGLFDWLAGLIVGLVLVTWDWGWRR